MVKKKNWSGQGGASEGVSRPRRKERIRKKGKQEKKLLKRRG